LMKINTRRRIEIIKITTRVFDAPLFIL
jgi:hypothetical protein